MTDAALQPARRDRAAGLIVTVAILVRLFVSSSFLNLFYDYDVVSGTNIALKIHPGTYLLTLAALFLAGRPVDRGGRVLFQAAVALTALTVFCILWAVVQGNVAAIGFLIDAEFGAAAACFCLSKLREADRQAMLAPMVALMAIHAAISFGESATHVHLIAYRYSLADGERTFRPTGLLNHPLTSGLYLCTMIPFSMLLRVPLLQKLGVAAVFAAAAFAAESRFASLICLPVGALSYITATRNDGRTGVNAETSKFFQLILGTLVFPLVALLGVIGGLGERLAKGLNDQSSKARIDAYSLLSYLSPSEFFTGIGSARIAIFSAQRNGLIIESPVVMLIFGFGVVPTILFLGTVGGVIMSLLRKSNAYCLLGALAFAIVASANNGLVTKTPELLFILTLLAASRGRQVSGEPAQAFEGSEVRRRPLMRPSRVGYAQTAPRR